MTMALPTPRPGLVIHFSYLWRNEFERGEEAGRKSRPVLILSVRDDLPKRIIVLPITHTEPPVGRGILIPPRVKDHLGLDAEKSWIIIDDLNVTDWPGYDLRPVPGLARQYEYGELPAQLFESVRQAVLALRPRPTPTPR